MGVFCLIIPAFSAAISGKVSPKNCIWSYPIFVITATSGYMIFVESKHPPKPTSMTAISTFCVAKYSKAKPTVISKNESCWVSKKCLFLVIKSTTKLRETSSPLIRIRSVKFFKWGDVYKPTL